MKEHTSHVPSPVRVSGREGRALSSVPSAESVQNLVMDAANTHRRQQESRRRCVLHGETGGKVRGPPRSYFFVKSPAFTIVIFDGSMYFRIASTSCCGVRAAIRFSSSMSYAIVRSR